MKDKQESGELSHDGGRLSLETMSGDPLTFSPLTPALSPLRGEGDEHGPSFMQTSPFLSRRDFARWTGAALAVALAGLPKPAKAENSVRHRFLCCDYQGNKVAIISADGAVEWEFTAQTPQDCWWLPNGHVLFCYQNGAKEVARDQSVVWEYKAPPQAQCHSCQPLPDGRVLVAECGLSRLIEAGRDGKIAKEIKVASQAKNMGHQFRGTRKTADGHYWSCLMDEKKIVELAPDGALLREIPVDGFPHAAIKLPNRHLLVTLGTAGKVIELDRDLKIVWQIGQDELPGNPLRLPAGCQRLDNGNTIVCNYLPGPFMGKQPQAFEVTRDKRVVWEFTDHARFKTLNQIYLLDSPNAGKTAELLR